MTEPTPDDPALGEFRKTFGGTVGTFDEYITPGYEGITEVVSSSDLWTKWREGGPGNRVDSRAFLKARLFDSRGRFLREEPNAVWSLEGLQGTVDNGVFTAAPAALADQATADIAAAAKPLVNHMRISIAFPSN